MREMKDTHTLKKNKKKKHALKKITEKNFCINPVGEIFFSYPKLSKQFLGLSISTPPTYQFVFSYHTLVNHIHPITFI